MGQGGNRETTRTKTYGIQDPELKTDSDIYHESVEYELRDHVLPEVMASTFDSHHCSRRRYL